MFFGHVPVGFRILIVVVLGMQLRKIKKTWHENMTKTFIKHDFQQKSMLNYSPNIKKYDEKTWFISTFVVIISETHKFAKLLWDVANSVKN